jgi:hypothetical protein
MIASVALMQHGWLLERHNSPLGAKPSKQFGLSYRGM